MEETAAQTGLTGRPGSNPESGVKSLPLTLPSSLPTHTHTQKTDRVSSQIQGKVSGKQRAEKLKCQWKHTATDPHLLTGLRSRCMMGVIV